MRKSLKKFIGFLMLSCIVATFIASCGYMPLSHYSKQSFGESVYIDIDINARDPQNSVFIKDTLVRYFSTRLGVTLTNDREKADSIIKVSLLDSSFNSLAENASGFTSFYRCKVTLLFDYVTLVGGKKERVLRTVGYYNFALDQNSILTESQRYEAINQAAMQAIDMFISRASIEGY